MSNQAIRDKDKSKTQDELREKYGLPIWILDKQWIVDKVYSNNRFDIAISTLNISYTENKQLIGFNDAEKLSDLAVVEKQIDDFDFSINSGYQFVEDCLYAAILSRELEKPQFEVYGRFERAKRVAEEFGVNQQVIRTTYQHAWTAYWWFNDFKLANKLYDELETLTINSNQVWDLEKLCNLFTVLQAATHTECLTFNEAKLDSRYSAMLNKLSTIANDKSRPNASTAAKFHMLLLELSKAFMNNKSLSNIFYEFELLLDATHNLIDVPIDPLIKIIKELNNFIEDSNFDNLFEKIIAISSAQLSNEEKGKLLIQKGLRKLQSNNEHEAIRLFARAISHLLQYEHRHDFIQAQALIASTYESMGLFWAARGCYAIAVHQINKDFDEHGTMHQVMTSLLSHLVWIEIRLGRVPCALMWLSLKNIIESHILEIVPDQKSNNNELIDTVLGILILKTKYTDLDKLSFLPDLLDRFGLFMPEFAALYALGHDKEIKTEFKFEDDLCEFCTSWLNQPANTELPKYSVWNADKRISISSLVLGVKFNFDLPNNKELLLFAESILSAIECFLTTGMAHKWFPIQANVNCIVKTDSTLSSIYYKEVEGDCGEIAIHISVRPDILCLLQDTKAHKDIFELVIKIICEAVIYQDDDSMKAMIEEDLALDRMNHLINLPTILDNILGSQLRYSINQWKAYESDRKFELMRDRPWSKDLYHSNTTFNTDTSEIEHKDSISYLQAKHNKISSTSIINVRLWDKAKWFGTLYAFTPYSPIQILGLGFRNVTEGLKIFNGWKKRLGNIDTNEEINISIITGIDKNNPHHYKVMVSPDLDILGNENSKLLICVNRFHTMTPNNSINLDNFKKYLLRGLGYLLIPAQYSENSPPEMAEQKYWIKKNKIRIIEAWKIGRHDIEASAINATDNPIIPENVANPPVFEILRKRSKA